MHINRYCEVEEAVSMLEWGWERTYVQLYRILPQSLGQIISLIADSHIDYSNTRIE